MSVIQFPGHLWAHCETKHCTGCFLCHGGLALCRTCGGLEGGLTTDCPGKRLPLDQQDAVYAGKLDYRRGQGLVPAASKFSPGYYAETEEKN